jgi:FkbM family methyltransferase
MPTEKLTLKNITLSDYIRARLNAFLISFKCKNIDFKIVKNWYDIILFKIKLKKQFVMKFKNGKTYKIKNIKDYSDFWSSGNGCKINNLKRGIVIENNFVKFKYRNRELKFYFDSQRQLKNTVTMIKENFLDEQFKDLNIKEKEIVDIGANVGDSAIYFALNGARYVYAFEPYPYSYDISIKNIKQNKLEKKISCINKGCGKKGFLYIDKNFQNIAGSNLKKFEKGKRVEILSLLDILKSYKIKNDSVAKVDCEGHEYDLILNARDEELRMFHQFVIEYHYGYINLVKRLKKAGFFIKHTPPVYFFNEEAERPKMYYGLIYANIIN